ncbi:MAG: recombinase family protein [Desulfosporosinus sp.]|nr:recombinase family protein [Desulfosporosinus sp.]
MAMLPPKRKVVGYARVSSETQVDNTSIEEQMTRIKAYCIAQSLQLVKIFTDEGRTGSKIEPREQYQAMIEYVTDTANGLTGIVVLKSDRIHRSLKNLLIMIEDQLDPASVAFISVSESFDTSTAQGKLFLQMLGSFAEFERRQINDRTKGGRLSTAQAGGYAGGKPPYGYSATNKSLVLDKKQAAVVKRIYKEYLDGASTGKIAELLNKDGVETQQRGKLWAKQTVAYVLSNSLYTGKMTYDGPKEGNAITVKGEHEAIISVRAFNKVQELKKANTRKH